MWAQKPGSVTKALAGLATGQDGEPYKPTVEYGQVAIWVEHHSAAWLKGFALHAGGGVGQ